MEQKQLEAQARVEELISRFLDALIQEQPPKQNKEAS